MASRLYPLKFEPRFLEKLWGGRKIETVLGKRLPPGKLIGESWEVYDFPPGVVDGSGEWVSSRITNGPLAGRTLHDAVREFGPDLYGDVPLVGEHGQFPVLIKFLDARQDLSIQVHPDRAYAAANPGSHLKSEAWYVLQSDPGSRVLNGLVAGTKREGFEAALTCGEVERLIRSIPAKAGDCFDLPSGTVHALGAGILVAEVQTPSDTTFRLFDFNRSDPATGKPRPLQIEQALACIDFSAAGESQCQPRPADSPLVASPYFHLCRRELGPGATRRIGANGPAVLILVDGAAQVRCRDLPDETPLARGEVVLFPAALSDPQVVTSSGGIWLEVTFPRQARIR